MTGSANILWPIELFDQVPELPDHPLSCARSCLASEKKLGAERLQIETYMSLKSFGALNNIVADYRRKVRQ